MHSMPARVTSPVPMVPMVAGGVFEGTPGFAGMEPAGLHGGIGFGATMALPPMVPMVAGGVFEGTPGFAGMEPAGLHGGMGFGATMALPLNFVALPGSEISALYPVEAATPAPLSSSAVVVPEVVQALPEAAAAALTIAIGGAKHILNTQVFLSDRGRARANSLIRRAPSVTVPVCMRRSG